MKDSKIIIFLYRTVVGRFILRLLVNPKLSIAMAGVMSSPVSGWAVPRFIRKNKIDMSLYEVPEGGFRSFNEFFTRKKKEEFYRCDEGEMVSPCDALLTVAPINKESVFNIKHTEYSVGSLLDNEELGREFLGGTAYIFRLTPAHYHRYIYGLDGTIDTIKKISGVLHSVQPVCHEQTDVFVQNSREYVVIHNDTVGSVVQMEVGALLVGKISNIIQETEKQVRRGQEKGYFEYGGSSIVVLTKSRYELPETLVTRPTIGDEIPVFIGERII